MFRCPEKGLIRAAKGEGLDLPFGFHNRILHVDLGTGSLTVEAPGEAFFRRFLGGRALIAHYLLTLVPADADPLGPENVLIFAPGVVTGAAVSGQGRNGVGALSPLTGGLASAEGGGYFGAELKRAGFDAVVVRGRAPAPVYLWIHNGQAELRDASHLWGLEVGVAEDAIRAAHGSDKIRTALIGPAGENRVRFACVVNDRSHFAGRGGLGAVMGAKQLKAVAVLAPAGKFGLMEVQDPAGTAAVQKWMGQNLPLVKQLHELGTTGGVRSLNASGGLPVRNFQAGSWEHAEAYSGETMNETGLLIGRDTCNSCAVRCKRVVALATPYAIDSKYGGPEYETLSALGNMVGVHDLQAIAKANERCAAYGLDSISLGAVIAFAMECRQRGLLPEGPAFGDTAAMLELVEKITFREGELADLLAEGALRAARRIGGGAEAYAMHVKGQELPMHEPRIKHGLGLGYAVSPTGADHMHNMHDTAYTSRTRMLELAQVWGPFAPIQAHGFAEEKLRLLYHHIHYRHALDSMVMCMFLPYSPQQQVDLIQACTGWSDFDVWELLQVGRRANTLSRLVNMRRGFTAADDTLPARLFTPLADSRTGAAIDPSAFAAAKRAWYSLCGWDPETGAPGAGHLAELDLAAYAGA